MDGLTLTMIAKVPSRTICEHSPQHTVCEWRSSYSPVETRSRPSYQQHAKAFMPAVLPLGQSDDCFSAVRITLPSKAPRLIRLESIPTHRCHYQSGDETIIAENAGMHQRRLHYTIVSGNIHHPGDSQTNVTMRPDRLCPGRYSKSLFTSCITRDIDCRVLSTYSLARRKLSRASVHIDAETVRDDKVLVDLVSRMRINQPSQSTVCALAEFPEARQFAGISCIRLVSSCCPPRLHNDPCQPSQAQRGI